MKVFSSLRAITTECKAAWHLCSNWESRIRLMTDFALSHFLFLLPKASVNTERHITTRQGVRISYRLNRGDLQGIREVWCDEVYRLPFRLSPGALLDLGANIGLTTLWMAKHHEFSRIIALEPDHDNASLARKNLDQNGLVAEVIEAAVGPTDGTVRFQKSEWSNLGHIDKDGDPVMLMTVGSLIQQFDLTSLALVKVDIEGAEQELFLGPKGWFRSTQALIVEFHPASVEYQLLIQTVISQGFDYIQASDHNMDCFLRNRSVSAEQGAPGTL